MTAMDIVGIGALALHIIVIFLIVFWFALGKPKTLAQFRLRFLRDFIGYHPKPSRRA